MLLVALLDILHTHHDVAPCGRLRVRGDHQLAVAASSVFMWHMIHIGGACLAVDASSPRAGDNRGRAQ